MTTQFVYTENHVLKHWARVSLCLYDTKGTTLYMWPVNALQLSRMYYISIKH